MPDTERGALIKGIPLSSVDMRVYEFIMICEIVVMTFMLLLKQTLPINRLTNLGFIHDFNSQSINKICWHNE